jgi:hypothetical protein
MTIPNMHHHLENTEVVVGNLKHDRDSCFPSCPPLRSGTAIKGNEINMTVTADGAQKDLLD